MTNIDDLHNESRVLPIKEHTHMLAQQYVVTCNNPRNPCHSLSNKALPHRPLMKPDLFYKYEKQLSNIQIDSKEVKRLQKAIHTRTVSETSRNFRAKPVYGDAPPKIHETESSLPRVCRTPLAQLRNGYCRLLNSYMSRIDEEIEDVCPNCNNPGHKKQHLFECQANTTELTVDALLKQPVDASAFLKLEDD